MPRITYHEPDREFICEHDAGGTILEVSLAHGIAHYHACDAKGRCTTCRVLVVAGHENLRHRTPAEGRVARQRRWPDEIRLACQARLTGDVVVRRLVVDDVDAELIYPGCASPEPGCDGHEASLAVMFCDIGDFTTFAAGHLPHDVVHLVNRYYQAIGEAILWNHGYIDKYMGDGIMALFSLGERDARRCCRAAIRAGLQAMARMAELNRYAERHFGRRFDLRIGLHYGPVVIGRVGHASKRQLTAIGDTVNVASRIEAQAKELRVSFLASQEVVSPVGQEVLVHGGTPLRTRLRGQARSHRLLEIVGLSTTDFVFVVQSTFAQLMPQADHFAAVFYEHLFRLDPSLRALFTRTDFVRQRRMLLNMIGVTVRGLDRLDGVVPTLRDLGRRHVGYGVRPEHYETASRALLSALENCLGGDFTPEVREAWAAVFTWMRDVMLGDAVAAGPIWPAGLASPTSPG
jgi:class 3 adenylate cyclase/hemoglobin-like flavoprotein